MFKVNKNPMTYEQDFIRIEMTALGLEKIDNYKLTPKSRLVHLTP